MEKILKHTPFPVIHTLLGLGKYRYSGRFRLPALPAPDPNRRDNAENIRLRIMLWDGRNELYQSDKTTLEAVLTWVLNPWNPKYGEFQVLAVGNRPVDTGIARRPDTEWHRFELVADLTNQTYVSVGIDGQVRKLNGIKLARVPQPQWGNEVAMTITTESLASWPQPGCAYIFKWTTQFQNLMFSRRP